MVHLDIYKTALLSNPWVKQEIKTKITVFIKMNNNEDTSF